MSGESRLRMKRDVKERKELIAVQDGYRRHLVNRPARRLLALPWVLVLEG